MKKMGKESEKKNHCISKKISRVKKVRHKRKDCPNFDHLTFFLLRQLHQFVLLLEKKKCKIIAIFYLFLFWSQTKQSLPRNFSVLFLPGQHLTFEIKVAKDDFINFSTVTRNLFFFNPKLKHSLAFCQLVKKSL